MACVDTLNMSSELNLTPSRKRKRQYEKLQQQQQEQNAIKSAAATTSCFTNAAFSSTPKKILGKRRLQLNTNKENTLKFVPNLGLEVKSIAELAKTNNEIDQSGSTPKNPYEVLRKPPKKKKRPAEDAACFENPALNLELPEKQFNHRLNNVVRDVNQSASNNCFVNPALNLKIQDPPASRNPFEIQRESSNETDILHIKTQTDPALRNPFEIPHEVVEEPGINQANPCHFKIGLPFVPTVGCRIDFKDLSMSQLTPSKLLTQKLVFSPVPRAKVSLGSMGEETTMDIGKELDLYQLELENSINEAKLRKNGILEDIIHSPDNYQIQVVDTEKRLKFTQKLTEISEDGENEGLIEETTEQTEHHIQINIQKDLGNSIDVETDIIATDTNPFEGELIQETDNNEATKNIEKRNPFIYDTIEDNDLQEDKIEENLEELYGCADNNIEDEDSFDFKTPAPFVRAYTKAEAPKLTVSRESLKDDNFNKPRDAEEHLKKPMNVKNIIRKSIRKLMHPHQHSQEHKSDEENHEKPEHEKHNGIMNAIRQSLRRKPAKSLLEDEPEIKECEISIIDSSERTMKFKSDLLQTEYAKIEDLTNEKKHNIRNSIRKSTREVRNHFMKSIFHKKQEEYDFNK